MIIPNFDFISKLKLSDFSLACATILSIIYPTVVGLFIFERDFITENGVAITVLVSIGFGTVIMSIVVNNTASILIDHLRDSPVSMKTFKKLLPHVLLNQSMSFGLYFPLVLSLVIMDRWINSLIEYRYNPTFFMYIIGFIAFNSIDALIKKSSPRRPKADDGQPDGQPD